jgi:hypothetical protein
MPQKNRGKNPGWIHSASCHPDCISVTLFHVRATVEPGTDHTCQFLTPHADVELSAFREPAPPAESATLAELEQAAAIRTFRAKTEMVLAASGCIVGRCLSQHRLGRSLFRLVMPVLLAHILLQIAFKGPANGVGTG